jgi:hypothetical protein
MADKDQNNAPRDAAGRRSETRYLDGRNRRSLDIGAQGQFAPGGVYNQQGATQTDRMI